MSNTPQRRVRSFVRRPGRMTPSQARALDALWPERGVEFDGRLIDFVALFGREAEVVLEIGYGNGDTLVEMAAARPEQNFMGIEVHEPGVGHCLIAAEKQGISNLRLIMHDAIDVLSQQVPDGALTRINLYFPDPWPKKRHHKRRLIQPAFLELVADKLAVDGRLCIATDWANYAEHIDETIDATDRFRVARTREHGGDAPIDRPITKFERRGLAKGHRIRDWHLVRL